METIENTAIEPKEDGKILKQSNALVQMANDFNVDSDIALHQAVELEKDMKLYLETYGTYHDKEIELANALHKHLCSKRNAIVDGVKLAWKALKDRRAAYQAKQEEERLAKIREAEAKAKREEAEKQAKIQAKIDEENAKIEAQRREEARIQAEKDAEIAKIRNKAKAEEMRVAEEARRKEQARIDEEARLKAASKVEALVEKKENVYVAPKAVANVAAPQGASITYAWIPKVVNKALVPQLYLVVDEAMLKSHQTKAKGSMVIPGVEFTKTPVGATRGAK